MTVKIYVEGGGHQNKDLATRCRLGFGKFFERAGFRRRMPKIIVCGSRQEAFKDFRIALGRAGPTEFPVLLVDSEAPVTQADPWMHVRTGSGDNWTRPTGATGDHLQLMVQAMEAWFLADKAALGEYFKTSFHEQALSANPNVEKIPKADLFSHLKLATRGCRKGSYSKGDHSFGILSIVDPQKVRTASPVHGARLLDTLDRIC